MSTEVPADLWKKLTSTVGLVCVRHRGATNLMSAEWSYFVNKAPLYAAVVLGPRATTRELIAAAGEFTVTFCSEEQSELADFAGSFSTADVDKTTSDLVRLGEPEATGSPWVRGGLTAVECTLRQTVAFPVHTMYVGEVVAAHTPDPLPRPLVKHGAMHRLGGPAERTAAVVAAQLLPGGLLRVAATGPPDAGGPWRLSLLTGGPDARAETAETDALDTLDAIDLGSHVPAPGGDLTVDLPLPEGLTGARLRGCRVRAERDGAKAGHASPTGTPR